MLPSFLAKEFLQKDESISDKCTRLVIERDLLDVTYVTFLYPFFHVISWHNVGLADQNGSYSLF